MLLRTSVLPLRVLSDVHPGPLQAAQRKLEEATHYTLTFVMQNRETGGVLYKSNNLAVLVRVPPLGYVSPLSKCHVKKMFRNNCHGTHEKWK